MEALQLGPSVTTALTGASIAVEIPALRGDGYALASSAIQAVGGASDTYVSAGGLFGELRVGDVVVVAGFVVPSNNGRKTIISKTGSTVIKVAENLANEPAGPAVTFVRQRLPSYVAVLSATAADAKVRPWNPLFGAAPAAALNMLLPVAEQEVLSVLGCTRIILTGVAGDVAITALENG